MKKPGFSLIESLVGLSASLFVFLAALEFFSLSRDIFMKLKTAAEDAQATAAALDKIRFDLLQAGAGLVLPMNQGTVDGLMAEARSLLISSLADARELGQDVLPGETRVVVAAAIPSTSGFRPGREICLVTRNHSELHVISAVSSKTIFLSSPAELTYPQDDGRLLLLEKTRLFLEEPSGILRRKVNASSPQPLLEGVAEFHCSLDPESKLARIELVLASDQEKTYVLTLLPKNLGLARHRLPAE